VAPFILKSVTLAGIDSVIRLFEDRIEVWSRLGDIIEPDMFDTAFKLSERKVRGRVVFTL